MMCMCAAGWQASGVPAIWIAAGHIMDEKAAGNEHEGCMSMRGDVSVQGDGAGCH